jgi:hypothetical protein
MSEGIPGHVRPRMLSILADGPGPVNHFGILGYCDKSWLVS